MRLPSNVANGGPAGQSVVSKRDWGGSWNVFAGIIRCTVWSYQKEEEELETAGTSEHVQSV